MEMKRRGKASLPDRADPPLASDPRADGLLVSGRHALRESTWTKPAREAAYQIWRSIEPDLVIGNGVSERGPPEEYVAFLERIRLADQLVRCEQAANTYPAVTGSPRRADPSGQSSIVRYERARAGELIDLDSRCSSTKGPAPRGRPAPCTMGVTPRR